MTKVKRLALFAALLGCTMDTVDPWVASYYGGQNETRAPCSGGASTTGHTMLDYTFYRDAEGRPRQAGNECGYPLLEDVTGNAVYVRTMCPVSIGRPGTARPATWTVESGSVMFLDASTIEVSADFTLAADDGSSCERIHRSFTGARR